MFTEKLKQQVIDIERRYPQGFTFNPFENSFPKKGYVVALKDTQDCVGKTGLFNVIKCCVKNKCCIGGWRNEDGLMQFDASVVYTNIADAIAAAVKNEQRAIYNLYTGMVIPACEYKLYCASVA